MIMVQDSLYKSISKITTEESTGGIAQAVQPLPSKCEALSLNTKKERKEKEMTNLQNLHASLES
jgi:hypothetical protein